MPYYIDYLHDEIDPDCPKIAVHFNYIHGDASVGLGDDIEIDEIVYFDGHDVPTEAVDYEFSLDELNEFSEKAWKEDWH